MAVANRKRTYCFIRPMSVKYSFWSEVRFWMWLVKAKCSANLIIESASNIIDNHSQRSKESK